MITCPVCNSMLDEMGHPQVKCPHCGTIIDTQFSPGGPAAPPPPMGPFPPGYIPQGPPQMPSAYIAPPGMQGVQTIQHAGLVKRFIAWLIDIIVIFIITRPLTFIFLGSPLAEGSDGFSLPDTGTEAIYDLVIIVITIAYFIYMESSRSQTIGKMALDIIVIREDLQPITMDDSIKRNIVRVLYSIPTVFALIYLIDGLLIYGDEQRIGDKFANTFVVDKNFVDYITAQARMAGAPTAPPPTMNRPDEY